MKNEFKCCAIVPVYRHEKAVRAVVKTLTDLELPVLLIDDGNTPQALSVLKSIVDEFPTVHLISHKVNLGKGGAVCSGLREALSLGFTHALQIDADGQHDAAMIPFLLKAAKKHADSLVGGFPQYDASVPKGREAGRKITNFWVAVETLSKSIPDAMCGFRVYPLSSTVPVLSRIRTFRMGFDIEILVRLSWAGVKQFFYPVKVLYPAGGVSNFRMFRDNVEISWIHARLVCGMIGRLPKLLWRRRKLYGK